MFKSLIIRTTLRIIFKTTLRIIIFSLRKQPKFSVGQPNKSVGRQTLSFIIVENAIIRYFY